MRDRPTVDYDKGLKRCSTCTEWLPFDQFHKSPHKNGGCGLKSYCKACDKIRYPYEPRLNPKKQPKQHIFDMHTREELRQCSECAQWLAVNEFFMHGRFRSNLCKPCERERARERARQNIERHVAAARRWATANTEKIKARKPAYQRKYAIANRSRILTRMREYMRVKSKTPEYRAHQREYDRRTGKGAEKAARRRALILGVTVEPVDRNAIIKRDRRICYLCGVRLKWREITLDHVIPLALGGAHTPENLRVACGPCNYSKQHRPLATLPLPI